MAAKKFTVSHYLNTKAKPKDGNRYPVYIRVTYDRKSNSMASFELKNEYLTENEFNFSKEKNIDLIQIPRKGEKTNNVNDLEKKKILYFLSMRKEHNLLHEIFDYFVVQNKVFSIYRLESYVNLFQIKTGDIVKQELSSLIKLELCEWFAQTSNLKYSVLQEVINDNIYSNRVDIIREILKVSSMKNNQLLLCSLCDIIMYSSEGHSLDTYYSRTGFDGVDLLRVRLADFYIDSHAEESLLSIITEWKKVYNIKNINENYDSLDAQTILYSALQYLTNIVTNYLNQKIDEVNKSI